MPITLDNTIDKDIMTAAKYTITVDGIPRFITERSGLQEPIDVVDLPDGSQVTGGRTPAQEFTIMVPQHHEADIRFFDAWHALSKANNTPRTVYRIMTATSRSNSGALSRTSTLLNVWVKGKTHPDLSIAGTDQMTSVEYTMCVNGFQGL